MIIGLHAIGGYVAEREGDQRYHDEAEAAWRKVMKLAKTIDEHFRSGHDDNSMAIAKGGWVDLEKHVDPKLKSLFIQLQPKDSARAGGFGRGKLHADNPDTPTRFVIVLYLEREFLNAVAHGHMAETLKPLASIWYHEFAHYLDTIRSGDKIGPSEKSVGGKLDYKHYFNTPTEVNAYFHQLMRSMYHELRRKKNFVRNIASLTPDEFVRHVIRFLPQVSPGFWESLTPENQKRLRLRMASYFKDVIVPDANATMARAANRRQDPYRSNGNVDEAELLRFAKKERVEHDLACPHCGTVMGEKDGTFQFNGETNQWTHTCAPDQPFLGTEEQEAQAAAFAKQFGLLDVQGDRDDPILKAPVSEPVPDPASGVVPTT